MKYVAFAPVRPLETKGTDTKGCESTKREAGSAKDEISPESAQLQRRASPPAINEMLCTVCVGLALCCVCVRVCVR